MSDQTMHARVEPLSNLELLKRFDLIRGSMAAYDAVFGFIKDRIQPNYDLPLRAEYSQNDWKYRLIQKTKLEHPEVTVEKPSLFFRMLGIKEETFTREYSEKTLIGAGVADNAFNLWILENNASLIAACEEARSLTNNQINLRFGL